MALVKFGAGVSEMRGKEGGIIYSRNAFGSYIKTKVSPINPQTGHQQTQRSLMGNLSKAWALLSVGDKSAWDNLGAQVTRINRFGDSTTYTGFALFMRLNRNLSAVGQAMITTAPALASTPQFVISSFAAGVGAGTINLAFSPTTPGTDFAIAVYATNNIYGGRRFVKNFYRLIYTAVNPTTSPINLNSTWSAYFGSSMLEDCSLFVKAKFVSISTGFDGVPDVASTVVVA